MRDPRGMTLLEVIVATAIVAVTIVAGGVLMMTAGQMTRNAQETADGSDFSRLGGEAIATALRAAGMGASGGVWVRWGGAETGTPTKTNAVFGYDGTTGVGFNPPTPSPNGRDELWVVVPRRNVLQEPCAAAPVPGAYGSVLSPGLGALSVNCVGSFKTPPLPTGPNLLLVSNLKSAALITPQTFTDPVPPLTPGTITYSEQLASNFSNAPEKGGYQVADMIYPVQVFHFYVRPNTSGTGVGTALYRAQAVVSTNLTASRGVPFQDVTNPAPDLIADNIEDLQLTFGLDTGVTLGDPANYLFQNGLGPAYVPNLRSVRVTVVSTSRGLHRDNSGQILTTVHFSPLQAENNLPVTLVSNVGYRRNIYSKRIELPNLSPASL